MKMGGAWRMPTYDQIQELLDNCLMDWTTRGGKIGIEVTGPNGDKVFLPAAGNRYDDKLSSEGSGGDYWSSSLDTSTSIKFYARCLYFQSDKWGWCNDIRLTGHTVRAVCP